MSYAPKKAKRRARKIQIRADWNEIKIACMRDIVFAKFVQNAEIAAKLLATGDNQLVEGNYWHDTFWGVDTETGVGENNLGRILMAVRAELKNLDVEILGGDVTLTRFSLPEMTVYKDFQFAQKYEIEGEILNCRYRVRGRDFIGVGEPVTFQDDGGATILIHSDSVKISVYIGLKNSVAQVDSYLD